MNHCEISPVGRRRAFTLIELLVVIAIMAVLAGLVFGSMIGMRKSSSRKKAKTQIATIELGLEMFRQEYGSFPVSETDPENNAERGAVILYQALSGDGNDALQLPGDAVPSIGELGSSQKAFMEQVDPKRNPFKMVRSESGNSHLLIDPWGAPFRYLCYESPENRRQNQRNPASYDLYTHGLSEADEQNEGDDNEESWITNWD